MRIHQDRTWPAASIGWAHRGDRQRCPVTDSADDPVWRLTLSRPPLTARRCPRTGPGPGPGSDPGPGLRVWSGPPGLVRASGPGPGPGPGLIRPAARSDPVHGPI